MANNKTIEIGKHLNWDPPQTWVYYGMYKDGLIEISPDEVEITLASDAISQTMYIDTDLLLQLINEVKEAANN